MEGPADGDSPGWEHGVLPGLWYEAHYHCQKEVKAWTFLPAVQGVDGLIMRRVGEGWAMSAGSNNIVSHSHGHPLGARDLFRPTSTA